jgi:23S rRNA (pseudouridine1915-N3)-methyltransferase
MKIVVLSVGKKHDADIAKAIEKYIIRMRPYSSVEFQIIPNSNKTTESAAILKRVKQTDKIMLLDDKGYEVSNQGLVDYFKKFQAESTGRLVFIIGGSYGVTEELKLRADHVISLSKLVFPHQLTRLILVEQLYRTFSILGDGKYHHR